MLKKALSWCAIGLPLLAVACSPVDAPTSDEDGPAVRPAQLVPSFKWTHYHFEIDKAPLFDIIATGSEGAYGYQTNTEYWYVHSTGLSSLGEKDVDVTSTSQEGDPPTLEGDQEFTQPVYLTWQSFTSDPVSVGELYANSAAGQYLRVKVESGAITRVVWYQTTTSSSPANIAPSGTFTAVGGSVSVPSGQNGYYVDATIE